ncbi:MAG: Gfo/Idh/MocA family oxidoreductase [Candidatus Omnitrophota bacterium]|nr:Gfo/Idh/MocA family oxidoreductase [Candidatus Omnitrophota bacterium]
MSQAIEQTRVLVSGCGSIGKRHIANLQALGLSAITAVDPDKSACMEAERKLGVRIAVSFEEALRERPDIVVVASPNHVHMEQALQAAKVGADLFIEKPLSHEMTGVNELLTYVEQNRLVGMVGCNMRFHPAISKIKEVLSEQKLGKVYSVQAEFGFYLPWWRPGKDYRENYGARKRTGGGVILDAIHEIDALWWFFGPVRQAMTLSQKQSDLEIETEDVAEISLRFANGVLGHIHLDYLNRHYARNLKIIGKQGTLEWDWNQEFIRIFREGDSPAEEYAVPARENPNEMYRDEMRHFLSCVAERKTTICPIEDAAEVLSVAMSAKRSSEMVPQ